MRARSAAAAALAVAAASGCGRSDHDRSGTTGEPRATDGNSVEVEILPHPGEHFGAALRRPAVLRDAPRDGARVVARLGLRTRFRSRSVVAVARVHGDWAAVYAPELPNGSTAWIPLRDVRLLRETWSIDVDLSARSLVLRHRGAVYRRLRVAVGASGTETPPGTYGITDRLRTGGPGSPYGCCVLALSGRQDDIPQDWPGGDRLAIHGTNAPATIGMAASHGCLRASAPDLRVLMQRVPLGATVRIRA